MPHEPTPPSPVDAPGVPDTSGDSPQWQLDDWRTEQQNQRVFVAEINEYEVKASECLHKNSEPPSYIVRLDCGARPRINDKVSADVVEIVHGFDQLTVGAMRAIERWERYHAALVGAAEPPPTDSPDRRARVIMDVLCHSRRVPAEDLSRLPPGKPSEDRYVFEPIEPVISDENLTFRHLPKTHPGKVYFYTPSDPDQFRPPIEADYRWRPGKSVDSGGEPWWLVAGRVVFREEMWCVRWLCRREEQA